MDARVAYDATNYITNAIREVIKTLSETLLIVVIIIFLFLGSLRSVLVPVVAIPLSLIGAVFLMQVLGFTINLLLATDLYPERLPGDEPEPPEVVTWPLDELDELIAGDEFREEQGADAQ